MKHFLLSLLAAGTVTAAMAATPMYDEQIDPVPSLTVNSASWTGGVTVLKADYDNNVNYSVEVTVTNNGEVDFTPGDENFSLTFYETSAGDIQTFPISEALAAGESTTITLTGSFPCSDLAEARTINDRGTFWCNFRVRDNVKNTSAAPSWIDVYPNWIYFDLVQGAYNQKVSAIDFGFVAPGAQPERTVRLRNLCVNPLTVSYITLPDGFQLVTQLPLELSPIDEGEAADRAKDITISMDPEAVGVFAGYMTIYVDGAEEPLNVALNAARAGGDYFYENFEGATYPAGWIIDPKLTLVKPAAAVVGEGNIQVLGNTSSSTSDKGRAITPRLTAHEGETVMFQAGMNNISSYSDPVVDVYYSTDRANWTLLKEIRNPYKATEGQDKFSDSAPGLSSEGSNLLMYNVQLPEGEGYLAFDVLYARIDNVFGAHVAQVDHDLLFSKTNIPSAGIVNNTSALSFEVRNVAAAAEPAGSYTLHLLADGQEVKSITETPEMPNGFQTFNFTYTPRQAGETTLKAELRSGDYTLASAEKVMTIGEETCEGTAVVAGPGAMAKTGSNTWTAPVCLYYKKTLTEMIYTADMLSGLGLTPGTELTGMRFYGMSKKTPNDIQMIKIYIEPTELNTIAPADAVNEGDLNDEYLVCDIDSGMVPVVGTESEDALYMSPVFDTPYIWNGGNLRVSVRIELQNYDTNAYSSNDASMAQYAIMKGNDNNLSSGTWKQSTGMAHHELVFAKTPMTFSGNVVDQSNQAGIADAVITLTSGEVAYSGTSQADGTFLIDVIQSDKVYDVNVVKNGYNEYNGEVDFSDGNVVETIELMSEIGDGVKSLTADGISVSVQRDMIAVSAEGTLTIYGANGAMAAHTRGNAISTRNLSAGVYILKVATAEGETTVRFIKK